MTQTKKRQGTHANPGGHAKRKRLLTRIYSGDELLTGTDGTSIKSPCAGNLDDPYGPSEDSNVGEIICYGALCEVRGQLLPGVRSKIRKQLPQNTQYHLGSINLFEDEYALYLHRLGPVAFLDNDSASTMRQVSGQPFVRATAIVSAVCLRELIKKIPMASETASFPLSINILGPKTSGSILGAVLTRNDAFLQHPQWLQNGTRYINPHHYPPDDDLTDFVGLTENELRARHISKEFEGVLASLDGDGVEDAVNLRGVKTKLKSHQRVALGFIRRRESQEDCRRLDAELQLMMSLTAGNNAVYPATGGILADIMGLGKTFTMLCTILRTREQATSHRIHQSQWHRDNMDLCPTEATLVVVTSTQVLDVWVKEMQTHFEEGVWKALVFHGPQRTVNPMDLSNQHIVLTTYGTLVADAKADNKPGKKHGRKPGRKPGKILQRMTWYRVVLDEAHSICDHTIQSSKAAKSLIAEKRWCITGTPIQNKMEDLLSLLKFLRVQPFNKSAVFRQHILDPLRVDSFDKFRNMKALLHAVCLRRDERYLRLPEATYEIHNVKLSPHEKELYAATLRQGGRGIDEVVSGSPRGSRCAILFRTIMELRRLCNHGSLPIAVESQCDFCDTAEEDKLALLESCEHCPYCERDLRRGANPMRSTRNRKDVRDTIDPAPLMDANMMETTGGSSLAAPEIGLGFDSSMPDTLSSSKLDAIVVNLSNSNRDSKSLVFSFWTATLDLLRKRLTELNLRCLQIDGRVSNDERRRILEKFSQPEGPAILLMSIKTGAVGLTITAANRIHLIEPQWNPSVEQQAIARVLRMGQKRQVTVIRYIVEKTVEENIVALQKKKSNMAKFTLDSQSDDGVVGRLGDLNFVLDCNL